MIDTRITIKMIETAINKGIRDIECNPKRGVRNLVDLANHFTMGPFQKDVLNIMEVMLSNSNSPYYNMVSELVNNVDHNTIKTFGINIGYNSWNNGSKKIREGKKLHGYNIPWTIIFNFKNQIGDKISPDEIINIIKQGKRIGIYSYMFFMDSMDGFSDIVRKNIDCAFILYVPHYKLTEEKMIKIKSYDNIIFSILYDRHTDIQEFKKTIQLLHNNKCLFGIHSYYDDGNAKDILNNKWVNVLKDFRCVFGFLIQSNKCSIKNAALMHEYVLNSKTNQEHSSFLIDLYKDIARINKIISIESCCLSIKKNGEVCFCGCSNQVAFNIKEMSLVEILSKSKED
ncbi:hypothetical protein [Clostridium sp.]|uniref:hypothetical protein n=1 Tax=Clostridium sp. TaxID=1506 RepID=UPI003D6CFDAE